MRLISDVVHINDPVTGQHNFRVRSGNLVRSGVVECVLNIRVGRRSVDPHCNQIRTNVSTICYKTILKVSFSLFTDSEGHYNYAIVYSARI